MMMMMPRLQKWGSFFLPRKQKSLSLFLSSTKHPTARMREELLYFALREWRSLSLWPLSSSSSSSSKERVWESTSCIILSFVRIHVCFSLFLCLLGKSEAFSVRAFSSSFFILSFSLRVLVLGALFLHQLCWMRCFFQKREDEKVDRHPTPSSLFDCFCGKTLFFRFVLLNHTIPFPYSLFFFFLWRRTCVTQREFLKVVWNAQSLRKVFFFLSFFLSELYTS